MKSVKLTLRGINTNISKSDSSGSQGSFEFNDLDADTYVISASKKWYNTAKKTVYLEEGGNRKINIKMRIR